MGERLGIIAGAGRFARQALSLAREQGYACVVAGVKGAAEPGLAGEEAEAFDWFGPAELEGLASFFSGHGVREVVFVGKVDPAVLARRGPEDAEWTAALDRLPDASPTSVLRAVIEFLSARGLSVKDPGFLLGPAFRRPGLLGRIEPPSSAAADIAFGWPLARALADLDIGQTVVIRNRTVVAVEGLDGTDATIARAGAIAGSGCAVLKAARTRQDLRIDVPGVGPETVRACIAAGAAVLCVEAGKVAFFELEEAAALADANGLALIAR